jgi:hypothetical protein
MTELSRAKSFIVRVYRVDTEDDRKITGLVEALDGSGQRIPFADSDELAAVLKRGQQRQRGRKKLT